MKIFLFTKPKQTIKNLLFMLGLISLLITSLAIGTMIVYKFYPSLLSKLDKNIPDFYGKNIKNLYSKAINSKKEEEKLEYFSALYSELEDISTLNKFYRKRQESALYLIAYYLKNKENKKALEIAEKWKINYTYDFKGKFIYLDVLDVIDEHKANIYIDEIYHKNPDIQAVIAKKISFLVKEGKINEAYVIESKNEKNHIDNTSFQIFYIDKPATVFTAQQSRKIFKNDIQKNNNKFSFVFKHKFKSLSGLRLDIDNPVWKKVKNFEINLILDKREYKNIPIKMINHIKKIKDNTYEIDGEDPYFIFDLPSELIGFSGEIKIIVSVEFHKPSVLDILFDNKEWQLFYSKSMIFTEKRSKHLSLTGLKNNFKINNDIDVNYIRFDLPSIKNLKFKNIKIILNDSIILDKRNIKMLNAVNIDAENYTVTGHDPFLIFKTKDEIIIKKVSIQLEH